jgi:hypothetical protein
MTLLRIALGSLSLGLLLQGCATKPTPQDPLQHLAQVRSATTSATSTQSECPALFGKVCYGTVPGAMKCGCSTASPLGALY